MATTNNSEQTNLFGLDESRIWDTESAFQHLKSIGSAECKRTAERRLHELQIVPPLLTAELLEDELGRPLKQQVLKSLLDQARQKRRLVLFCQTATLPGDKSCLHANDARGGRYWIPLEHPLKTWSQLEATLADLQAHLEKPITIFAHGTLAALVRQQHRTGNISVTDTPYHPLLSQAFVGDTSHTALAPHLKRLEAESIHIIREAVAESENPAMLYSIGKDSAVMLHLARKAFYPAPPPFPLLHVDTRWKFQEMYLFRDHMAQVSGMDLLVHINPEAIEKDINPFDHGSALHTDITKTEGLKQALDKYKFDLVFGGARRDEEKSRAKERVFSFRSQTHRWDPKQQRPELWNLYNTRKGPGESIRVFPLSNWTELDIWQYILQENIPVVPLYFAKTRPVVERDGMLLLIDDDRFKLLPGETIHERNVRFRTLGCYPLTGAIESEATSLNDIILELINARSSERQGRAIDADASASMEKKKQEGYF